MGLLANLFGNQKLAEIDISGSGMACRVAFRYLVSIPEEESARTVVSATGLIYGRLHHCLWGTPEFHQELLEDAERCAASLLTGEASGEALMDGRKLSREELHDPLFRWSSSIHLRRDGVLWIKSSTIEPGKEIYVADILQAMCAYALTSIPVERQRDLGALLRGMNRHFNGTGDFTSAGSASKAFYAALGDPATEREASASLTSTTTRSNEPQEHVEEPIRDRALEQPKGAAAPIGGTQRSEHSRPRSIGRVTRGGRVVTLDDGSEWEIYPNQASELLRWSPWCEVRVRRAGTPLLGFDFELACSDPEQVVYARMLPANDVGAPEVERRTCAKCGLGWALKYFAPDSPICAACAEKERAEQASRSIASPLAQRLTGGVRDVVDGAFGRFGYDPTNPIPSFEEPGQAYYCSCLRCPRGHPFWFQRQGSVGPGPDGHVVDIFELLCFGKETHIQLYFDFYHRFGTARVPEGLSLANAEGRGSAKAIAGTFPENVNDLEPMRPSAPSHRWDQRPD